MKRGPPFRSALRYHESFSELMISIGIIGGGPGGLMTARYLGRKFGARAEISIFEASGRLGGKVLTERFERDAVPYEAGVAEIYGYSTIGPDPLKELIEDELGLKTTPIDGDALAMDGLMHIGIEGIRRHYGDATANAIEAFRKLCATKLTRQQYYEGDTEGDNNSPWARLTETQLLAREVPDAKARKYLEFMARSDIAADPYQTNGVNALKNFLMDVDGYIDTYSIEGGNSELIAGLAKSISAKIHLNHLVLSVGKTGSDKYRLVIDHDSRVSERVFDLLFICVPHNWLSSLRFEGETLESAMIAHIAHFDRPAHYLRLVVLFDKPFWGDLIPGHWFMTEAFGGSCVYDEGKRHNTKGYGVLNWLIPGSAVLAWGNRDKQAVLDAALDSLPSPLREQARAHVVETRLHRFLASVNAVPGGMVARSEEQNHIPEPREHPGLFVVGDYLFDSTLNGLLDSADWASDFAEEYVAKTPALSATPEPVAVRSARS